VNDLTAGFNQVVATVTRILIAPSLNMRAAVLLYAIIAVILLIVLVVGLLFVFSAPVSKSSGQPSAGGGQAPRLGSRTPKRRKDARRSGHEPNPLSTRARALIGVGVVVVVFGAWMAAGFTTSEPGFCTGCHGPTTAHLKGDKSSDPHARVACVSCHESGGVMGRYVADVPLRLLHLATKYSGEGIRVEYGQVTIRACSSCHAGSLPGVTTNRQRGLKVSHTEPLAASASCLDCHTMRGGIVSVHNAGMAPCLRCHDGDTASSACKTCHAGTTTAAARARTASFQSAQIRDVTCGGCHDEKRDCDSCHGVRMPHTTEFMSGAHARAATVDFWYSGGKTCRKCHTASRRPCTSCHSNLLGTAHGSSLRVTHRRATSSPCNTCHLQNAPIATRDFCKDVCHSKAAIAGSPR